MSDLRGKDYLTTKEASFYMGRGLDKFRASQIPYFVDDGIRLYRKADLQAHLERVRIEQWQLSGIETGRNTFVGTRAAKNAARV